MLDAERRVLGASRRAREALEGVVEGSAFPVELEPPRRPRRRWRSRTTWMAAGDAPLPEQPGRPRRVPGAAGGIHRRRVARAANSAGAPAGSPGDGVAPWSGPVGAHRPGARRGRPDRELIDDVLFLSRARERPRRRLARLDRARSGSTRSSRARAERGARRDQVEVDCPASFELPSASECCGVIVENLVANAIRYAGRARRARVKCAERGGTGLLIVSDNGLGVPDADLPRLFERFYRGDRGRSTRGTGLGLAIVKHVVAAAGGTVDASRTPGGGLTVTCALPLRAKV